MFLKDARLVKLNEKGWYIPSLVPCEIVLKSVIELENQDVLRDRKVIKATNSIGVSGFLYHDPVEGFKAIILSSDDSGHVSEKHQHP